MRADRKSKPQHKMIFALFAQRKEGFPSGGRKLQAVCRRRRLMRGDQSPLTQRLQSLALPPPTKRARQPHAATTSYLPKHKKTSPGSTRPIQSESNLRSAWAGALGGSSGWVREVWRVGRPLRKGSPCASKVFLTSLRESFNQRAELGAVGMAVKIKTA